MKMCSLMTMEQKNNDKRVYLIDYENVQYHGLRGVEGLTSKDEVVIFVGKSRETFNFDFLNRLLQSKAKVQFEVVEIPKAGKNALDFQLVAYLSMQAVKFPKKDYIIISKDEGYLAIIKYLKDFNISLKAFINEGIGEKVLKDFNNINVEVKQVKEIKQKTNTTPKTEDYVEKRMKTLFPKNFMENTFLVQTLKNALIDCTNLQDLHNYIQNNVPMRFNKKDIYNKCKRMFNELHATA